MSALGGKDLKDGDGVVIATCSSCDYPRIAGPAVCPACLVEGEIRTVEHVGTLYSYTLLPGREDDETLGLGYVDTSSGVRVLARLEPPHSRFTCDSPVRLASSGGVVLAQPAASTHA